MTEPTRPDRRAFLADLGKGSLAIAVFGLGAVACTTDGGAVASTATSTADEAAAAGSAETTTTAQTTTTRPETTTTSEAAGVAGGVVLERVDLGFVSAYVLARAGEAAIVDTGVRGSASAIEASLSAVGLGWDAVGHVILTHLHPDHIGSLGEVLTAAPQAAPYAGEADIAGIASPRPIVPIGDGDAVFDLSIIGTPGHTAGHVSILDPVGRILVAGDALNGFGGGVIGPNPDFADDLALANESVKKLAALGFETVVFGHGDPVESGGAAAVAALASEL